VRPLDPAVIAGIEREHCLHHGYVAADLAFVFGNRVAAEAMAGAAASFFARGTPHILVSGGATQGGEGTEAEAIAAHLLALGVPREAILLETQATHTGENVTFALPILARTGIGGAIRVACIGLFCTGRRYAMTLHRHWPDAIKSCFAVEYGPVRRGAWYRHDAARARVMGEVAKVPAYLAAGHIAEWSSPPASHI
jgi:hypothetical protein